MIDQQMIPDNMSDFATKAESFIRKAQENNVPSYAIMNTINMMKLLTESKIEEQRYNAENQTQEYEYYRYGDFDGDGVTEVIDIRTNEIIKDFGATTDQIDPLNKEFESGMGQEQAAPSPAPSTSSFGVPQVSVNGGEVGDYSAGMSTPAGEVFGEIPTVPMSSSPTTNQQPPSEASQNMSVAPQSIQPYEPEWLKSIKRYYAGPGNYGV